MAALPLPSDDAIEHVPFMSKALVLIDIQNDYFPGGAFPLWNAEATLTSVEAAIRQAEAASVPVVLVQHVAKAEAGPSPFFNEGTPGAAIHDRVRAAAPAAPVVVKTHADAFHRTKLDEVLQGLGATELLLGGMMTQNCVTHTALSKSAERYAVTILPDLCTTVSEILHLIALHGVSTRVPLVPAASAIAPSGT